MEKDCQLELLSKWTTNVKEIETQLTELSNKFKTYLKNLKESVSVHYEFCSQSTDDDSESESTSHSFNDT